MAKDTTQGLSLPDNYNKTTGKSKQSKAFEVKPMDALGNLSSKIAGIMDAKSQKASKSGPKVISPEMPEVEVFDPVEIPQGLSRETALSPAMEVHEKRSNVTTLSMANKSLVAGTNVSIQDMELTLSVIREMAGHYSPKSVANELAISVQDVFSVGADSFVKTLKPGSTLLTWAKVLRTLTPDEIEKGIKRTIAENTYFPCVNVFVRNCYPLVDYASLWETMQNCIAKMKGGIPANWPSASLYHTAREMGFSNVFGKDYRYHCDIFKTNYEMAYRDEREGILEPIPEFEKPRHEPENLNKVLTEEDKAKALSLLSDLRNQFLEDEEKLKAEISNGQLKQETIDRTLFPSQSEVLERQKGVKA